MKSLFPQRLPKSRSKHERRPAPPIEHGYVGIAARCRGVRTPIECAHVRSGTDGGVGVKPSDKWTISLCAYHHRQQHHIGEAAFEARYKIDLKALAAEFARRSVHWLKLARM